MWTLHLLRRAVTTASLFWVAGCSLAAMEIAASGLYLAEAACQELRGRCVG